MFERPWTVGVIAGICNNKRSHKSIPTVGMFVENSKDKLEPDEGGPRTGSTFVC